MRLKTGYRIALSAMMALALINVYVGKALDWHPDLPNTRTECAAMGNGSVIEEYCPICHFHLASFIETESPALPLLAVFEQQPSSHALVQGVSPEIRCYVLRAPPVLS